MKIIGVCGASGSGKSTVSACFAVLGGVVFDADEIYHDLVNHPSPCLAAIQNAFGDEVVENGALNRGKLRQIVFQREEKRLLLNQIAHAYVSEEIKKRIRKDAEKGSLFSVIDAPLLFEAGINEWCDMVVAVVADPETRIRRIVARDGIQSEEAKERIRHQLSDAELIMRSDMVIRNDASLDELMDQCRAVLQKLGIY